MDETQTLKVTDTETLTKVCKISEFYRYTPTPLKYLVDARTNEPSIQVWAYLDPEPLCYLILEVLTIDDDLPLISIDDYGHNLDISEGEACYWACTVIDNIAERNGAYQVVWHVDERNTPLLEYLSALGFEPLIQEDVETTGQIAMKLKYYEHDGMI